MCRIMIVEDDILIAEGLEVIIKSIDDKLEVFITGYAEEALGYMEDNNYDAFSLDIQLKETDIELGYIDFSKDDRYINKYQTKHVI